MRTLCWIFVALTFDAGGASAQPSQLPKPEVGAPARPATSPAPSTVPPPATLPAIAPNATPPISTPPQAPVAPPPPTGFGWLLVQMVLVLLAVCALAYALLRWGVRRFQASGVGRAHGMRVVARLSLEPRRSVYVVEIAQRYFVLGTAEGGLTTLAELDAETAKRLDTPATAPSRTTFRDIFLGKKRS